MEEGSLQRAVKAINCAGLIACDQWWSVLALGAVG